jgi:putative copper export protein
MTFLSGEQPALFLPSFIFVYMSSWYYISVWLHIIGGACWIGGMLFIPLVLAPGIKDHPDRKKLLLTTGLKFRLYGYIVLTIVFITGLSSIYFSGLSFSLLSFTESRYGSLVSVKIILFVTMIIISVFHDLLIDKKAATQMPDNQNLKMIARWTGTVLLIFSLVMAFIGVVISRR